MFNLDKKIHDTIDTPEFTRKFLELFKDTPHTKIESRFNTCESVVKIRYAGFISEDALVFDFATDKDKRFYREAGEIGQDVKFVIVDD